MKTVAIGLGYLVGTYFVVRAIVQLVTIDHSDASSYEADWGGPTLIGVLAVHCLPGVIALGLMFWGVRRLRSGRVRSLHPDHPSRRVRYRPGVAQTSAAPTCGSQSTLMAAERCASVGHHVSEAGLVFDTGAFERHFLGVWAASTAWIRIDWEERLSREIEPIASTLARNGAEQSAGQTSRMSRSCNASPARSPTSTPTST
jgi:hypothetical protein